MIAFPDLPAFVNAALSVDPLVARYRAFFALLDWERVPERDPRRPWPGRTPHPTSAYIKALLIKCCEGHTSSTQLRAFLVDHPLLVLEVGFRPVVDPTVPYGVDLERTVPGARWLRHQQQHLDHALLHALLVGTVTALDACVPALATTVAVDVKHSYAWVGENNAKRTLPQRFDPARRPRGDPDCLLGVKRRTNQEGTLQKEYLWGYGTGIVSTIASAPDLAPTDVVLAEYTQTFNHQDVTYFQPLFAQTCATLARTPLNLAADAAFDAWHVYQPCAAQGGIAAIPLNERGPRPARSAAGHPICVHGREMTPVWQGQHEDGYRTQEYRCPLVRPQRTGETCAHVQFAKGGCTKAINIELGGRMRVDLDRQSDAYRAIYAQRTSAERINSQATALGIERPHLRRLAAVTRLNTLIYIVINVRALQRITTRTTAHAPPSLCYSRPSSRERGVGG